MQVNCKLFFALHSPKEIFQCGLCLQTKHVSCCEDVQLVGHDVAEGVPAETLLHTRVALLGPFRDENAYCSLCLKILSLQNTF